jgi:protein dithiol:quinone oxidoreductase
MTGSQKPLKRGQLLTLGALSFLAVGFALFTQFAWDMQPCPWCILQRMVYLLIGTIAILTWFLTSFFKSAAFRSGTLVATLLSTVGLGVALYQLFVASKQQSCSFSQAEKLVMWTGLDERFPKLFQVTASCADAALAKLMGVPYELASGCLFAVLTFWAFKLFLSNKGS